MDIAASSVALRRVVAVVGVVMVSAACEPAPACRDLVRVHRDGDTYTHCDTNKTLEVIPLAGAAVVKCLCPRDGGAP